MNSGSALFDLAKRFSSGLLAVIFTVASFFGIPGLNKTDNPAPHDQKNTETGFNLTIVDGVNNPQPNCFVNPSWQITEEARHTNDRGQYHDKIYPGKHTIKVKCQGMTEMKDYEVNIPEKDTYSVTLIVPTTDNRPIPER
ncbi:MAG: hypothetical protein Q4A82_00875 [Corynebacterium sp.]|nr:hypothetical protein [Corynebacterium sp.]